MNRFIIFFLIIFQISTLKLSAECNYTNSENLTNIKNIEIKINNSKKFFSTIGKSLISSENILKNKKKSLMQKQ